MIRRFGDLVDFLMLGTALVVGGCDAATGPFGPGAPLADPPGMVASSTALRIVDPAVPAADLAALVRDNTSAALELLRRGGAADASFALSSQSLQLALAMTHEGARGTTESQIASALRWSLPKASLDAAFNALDQELGKRTSSAGVNLRVVNALFGQLSFAFQQPFVDAVAAHYGAPLSRLDFAGNAGGARAAINAWVKGETAGEIAELLSPTDINGNTRMTLVNAIRFVADWKLPFRAEATHPATFTRPDGSPVELPTMFQSNGFAVARGADWDAIELPYEGDAISMLVLVPRADAFASVVAGLDQAQLARIDAGLTLGAISLSLPRFELRSALPAVPVLQAMGMVDAFRPGTADLSGIGGAPGELFISTIVHQAVVRVDEKGTRAAAASAVAVAGRAAPPSETFRVDRPFLFFIRDKASGAILFLGRFTGT